LGTIVSALAIAGLLVWELYEAEPIVNFRLFRNLRLSVGSGMGTVIGFALFGSTFLLPQLTQDVLGYPAYRAGLVLFPRAAAMFCVMPVVGRLYNHVSPRILNSFGMLVLAFAYWELGHLSLGVGFWNFMPLLAETGVGVACSMVVVSTVSLSSMAPAQMTAAAGLTTLVRRVAGNIAYAVLATLVERRTQSHRAELIGNLSNFSPALQQFDASASARLTQQGYAAPTFELRNLLLANGVVNREATMMAYNDTWTLLAGLFIIAVPLSWLLPRSGIPDEQRTVRKS
jgi:DHA2 family multidrug resistance protein